MAGVRKDGILQTTTGGSGGSVDISGPLGSQPAADSVSVAIASDQLPLPIEFAGGVDQGEPNTVDKAWPVKITDGDDVAEIVKTSTAPTFAANKAIVVGLRETENNNAAPQSTRLITVGGYDNVADRAWRMPVWSNTSGIAPRADIEPGVMVRNLNPFATTSGTINGLSQTVSLQMMRYNAATCFISLTTGGSFSGTLIPRITDQTSTTFDTFAYDAITGERVTTLTVGRAYFVNVPATNTCLVQCTAFTSGSVTVKLAVSPESSGILTAFISGVQPTQKSMLFGSISQGAAGTTALVAADATRKVKLVSYQIVMDGAGTLQFTDGTANLSGAMPLADQQIIDMCGQPFNQIIETAAINRPLNIVTTGGFAEGHFSYFLEA